MVQCPTCNASIDADFGLVECPSCAAQLLIQLDGSVEIADAAPDEGTIYDASVGVDSTEDRASAAADANYDEPFEDVPFESSTELSDDAAAQPEEMFAAEETVADEFTPPAEEPVVEEAYPDFDAPEPTLNAATPYVAPNDSADLSDLADFGNSDVSSAREGSLRYNVRVSGIDTVDVRDAFREALIDRKFVWDTDQILRTIKNGECILRDVTATKAHVLITRLRTLPVDIEWEQYAIHQT